MVDTNFVRVIKRAFIGPWRSDYRYDERLQEIALAIVLGGDPKRVNWGVLDLGATVCTPRQPRCADCPVAKLCVIGRVSRAKRNSGR